MGILLDTIKRIVDITTIAILHAIPTKFILINAQKLFKIKVHKDKTENISVSSIPMFLKFNFFRTSFEY